MPMDPDRLRHDPLSDQGRAQHRNLLLAASIGIAVCLLRPTRISAFGLDLEDSKRTTLHVILALAIVYFEIAFYFAARGDYVLWQDALREVHADLRMYATDAARIDEDIPAHEARIARLSHDSEIRNEQSSLEL